jgi:5'-3' exonuclease
MITLLCDSHGLGYRAHHSTGSLDGGIAFGFLSTVLQLGERYRTNSFVFCWDGPGSLRKKLFPEYKASRTVKTQEEVAERMKIHTQFNALRDEILPAVGFHNHYLLQGYEADDLIAQTMIDNPIRQFIMVSSYHDLFQLLQHKNCKGQHLLSNGKLMTASSFMAEYRVPAREWASVKTLAGCPGDGVIGVYGVGEKTAIKYLLNELPEGKKKRLLEDTQLSGPIIHRNYLLVRLPFPGVKLAVSIRKDSFDEESVREVFSDLGFSSFVAGEQRERWARFCRGEFVRGGV